MTKPAKKNDRWKPLLFLTFVTSLLVSAVVFHWYDKILALREWIQSFGFWGPVVYLFIYISAVVALIPGTILAVFSGLLFGPVTGTIVASAGSTIGASLAFLIARYLARSTVENWVAKSEKLKKLNHLAASRGPLFVALVRLAHFPFNVVNYALGLTRVGFRDYFFWSWVCLLPGTFFLAAGAHAVTVGLSEGEVSWPLIAALMGIVIGLGVMVGVAKKKLGKKGQSLFPF